MHWQNRVLRTLLDPDEGNEAQQAYDEEEVDVRSSPSVEGSVVPGNVDEDEAADTDERTGPVESRGDYWLFRKLARDDDESHEGKTPAGAGKAPECPWPPRELSEQTAKSSASDEASWSNSAEDAEDNVLLDTRWVRSAEECETVGHDKSGSNALHRTADVEEDLFLRIGGESCECCPDTEPRVAKGKHPLVPENITQPSRDQDEGTNSQTVASDEPCRVPWS